MTNLELLFNKLQLIHVIYIAGRMNYFIVIDLSFENVNFI